MEEYKWPYLIYCPKREDGIYDCIVPFIESGFIDAGGLVVDFNCGFSPLRDYLKNFRFLGFDNFSEAIEKLKTFYPDDLWFDCSDDEFFEKEKHQSYAEIFLHLGICNEDKDYVSKNEALNNRRIIKEYSPKLVVLEISLNDRGRVFDEIVSNLVEEEYLLSVYKVIDIGIEDKSKRNRLVCVFMKDVR